jgi:signal peptidase II
MNKLFSKYTPKNIAMVLLIAIFFIADRYLKILALDTAQNQPFKLIGDLFLFAFSPNYYMAFSLPFGGTLLNIIIISVIIVLSLYIFYLILNKKEQKANILLLTVILFGAISNIQDRLVCGYVIDYLELKYFTVFNLADTAIFFASCYLIITSLKNKKYDHC